MVMRVQLVVAVVVAGLMAETALAQGKGGGARRPAVIEASVLTSMPVRELTVFKDGHAFVLHEDSLATDPSGNVIIDTLPTPVLGTFWPYSTDEHAKLTGVVSGRRTVSSEGPALSIRELIEANPGARVTVIEADDQEYEATIVGIPRRDEEPVDAEIAARADETQQQQRATTRGPASHSADFVLLEIAGGTKVLPLHRVRTLIFHDEFKTIRARDERRDLLTLRLDWGEQSPAAEARVGMVYLQRGVRWIPNYRIELNGEGQAKIKLQATIVNELVDLDGVAMHLVIGVPNFRFQDMVDPISLQDLAAQLAPQFAQQESQFQWALSNSIMSQSMEPSVAAPGSAADAMAWVDDAVMAGSRNEDLFIFTIPALTLRKGERAVFPVAEFTLPYEDVFALDVDFSPPPEVQNRQRGYSAPPASLPVGPLVMHRVRLQNDSRYPLTTAPAIVLKDGRLLAQSQVTYTSPGTTCDVDVTTAVELRADSTDLETGREPDAIKWGGDQYGRIDLRGVITLANFGAKPTTIEVRRTVLGQVDSAEQDGATEQTNAFEDVLRRQHLARWWGQYDWPYWWPRVNGVGRVTWNVTLTPGAKTQLAYTWHYFWR